MRGLLFYIHSSIHPIMGRHECHYPPESVLGTGDRTFCVTGVLLLVAPCLVRVTEKFKKSRGNRSVNKVVSGSTEEEASCSVGIEGNGRGRQASVV